MSDGTGARARLLLPDSLGPWHDEDANSDSQSDGYSTPEPLDQESPSYASSRDCPIHEPQDQQPPSYASSRDCALYNPYPRRSPSYTPNGVVDSTPQQTEHVQQSPTYASSSSVVPRHIPTGSPPQQPPSYSLHAKVTSFQPSRTHPDAAATVGTYFAHRAYGPHPTPSRPRNWPWQRRNDEQLRQAFYSQPHVLVTSRDPPWQHQTHQQQRDAFYSQPNVMLRSRDLTPELEPNPESGMYEPRATPPPARQVDVASLDGQASEMSEMQRLAYMDLDQLADEAEEERERERVLLEVGRTLIEEVRRSGKRRA